jgi:hypothetical protein
LVLRASQCIANLDGVNAETKIQQNPGLFRRQLLRVAASFEIVNLVEKRASCPPSHDGTDIYQSNQTFVEQEGDIIDYQHCKAYERGGFVGSGDNASTAAMILWCHKEESQAICWSMPATAPSG